LRNLEESYEKKTKNLKDTGNDKHNKLKQQQNYPDAVTYYDAQSGNNEGFISEYRTWAIPKRIAGIREHVT